MNVEILWDISIVLWLIITVVTSAMWGMVLWTWPRHKRHGGCTKLFISSHGRSSTPERFAKLATLDSRSSSPLSGFVNISLTCCICKSDGTCYSWFRVWRRWENTSRTPSSRATPTSTSPSSSPRRETESSWRTRSPSAATSPATRTRRPAGRSQQTTTTKSHHHPPRRRPRREAAMQTTMAGRARRHSGPGCRRWQCRRRPARPPATGAYRWRGCQQQRLLHKLSLSDQYLCYDLLFFSLSLSLSRSLSITGPFFFILGFLNLLKNEYFNCFVLHPIYIFLC